MSGGAEKGRGRGRTVVPGGWRMLVSSRSMARAPLDSRVLAHVVEVWREGRQGG